MYENVGLSSWGVVRVSSVLDSQMMSQLRPWGALNKLGTQELGDNESKSCGM